MGDGRGLMGKDGKERGKRHNTDGRGSRVCFIRPFKNRSKGRTRDKDTEGTQTGPWKAWEGDKNGELFGGKARERRKKTTGQGLPAGGPGAPPSHNKGEAFVHSTIGGIQGTRARGGQGKPARSARREAVHFAAAKSGRGQPDGPGGRGLPRDQEATCVKPGHCNHPPRRGRGGPGLQNGS